MKKKNFIKKIFSGYVFLTLLLSGILCIAMYFTVRLHTARAVFFLLAALVLSLILSRKLAVLFNELERAAKKIAAGDFSSTIFIAEDAESKKLAKSFNVLFDTNSQLLKELSAQKEELSAIIDSIQEGLLVINNEGKIRLTNNSFKKIFNQKEIINKFYWEILRQPDLGELIKRIQAEKVSVTTDLFLQNKSYIVSSVVLSEQQGIALFFRDTTELKQLEKVKRDFVVNASHELRTPLTAINGFAETLLDEVSGEPRRYVEIIKNHAERLIHIVQDIMLLSELDEKTLLKIEKVNLKSLITSLYSLFENRIKEKQLTFKVEASTETVINGDSFKLEQVFINLIDNAVKYTEKGSITVTIKNENNDAVIVIQDTGIGIPKEDINRLFERFYVVDKSRSRKMGGTGLGLSIVKHIVLLHNGSIEVESKPNQGTRFTIKLRGIING